mgnify:CR=1 FL=1
MTNGTSIENQLRDWLSQLAPEHKQVLMGMLVEDDRLQRSARLEFAVTQLRRLCSERNLDWDAMAEAERYLPDFTERLQPLLDKLHAMLGANDIAARELMQRVHDDFAYESASTEIDTPLAQVFEQKRGVCQDFAHLMAGALRAWGLPARYVSGYLLTRAPGEAHDMVGADASHAWVQVWCPGTPGVPEDGADGGWLGLDPTNRLLPGVGHVRVAIGRDFGDVTPLRGVIRGGGASHRLAVAVHTRVLDAATEGAGDPARPLLA